MCSLDRVLVYEARKLITAANVHYVDTWILCFQILTPGTLHQKRYEQLLRKFIATKRLMRRRIARKKLAMERGILVSLTLPQ